MDESFWAIPDVADVRTPLSILREQASALTRQTKGTLVGIVETENSGDGDITITLDLSVPALNDYRYRVLSYQQPIGLYPGRISPYPQKTENIPVPRNYLIVADESSFVSGVKDVLSSDRVKKALTALLAQARSS